MRTMLIALALVLLASQASAMEIRYYTASWCAPCKWVGPMIERWAARHPEVTLVKVNIDSVQGRRDALSYHLRVVPDLVAIEARKVYSHGRIASYSPGNIDRWYEEEVRPRAAPTTEPCRAAPTGRTHGCTNQPRTVHTWHEADITAHGLNVRFRG